MRSHADTGTMRPVVLVVAPDAPAGLIAESSAAGVELSWIAPVQAASISIRRATDPSMAGATLITPTTQPYTDVPPASGTYYYTATAVKTLGGLSAESSPTGPVSASFVGVPALSLSPAALTFKSPLNVSSASQQVSVQNTGTAPLQISSIWLGGSNADQFTRTHNCPRSLAVNGHCEVTVQFKPTSIGGSLTKTAQLNLAAPASPGSVALTGIIDVPTYAATPNPVQFGDQRVAAGPTAWKVVNLMNTGTAPLTITEFKVGGPNKEQFSFNRSTSTPCRTLNPGASCTVNVRFDPSSIGLKAAVPESRRGSGQLPGRRPRRQRSSLAK